MCGFAGFLNFKADFLYNKGMYEEILENMCTALYHRGQDEKGKILTKEYGLAHTRLSIIDIENGKQPMTAKFDNNTYRIVYNGEIYNTKEIREELRDRGWVFETNSDTEVILIGFIEFGIEIVNILNGIFAFFVVDEGNKMAYLVRDQVGVKPLYYTEYEGTLVFSSEIKGIFEFPDVVPKIDMDGFNEVLSLGPAKTYGSGVFKGIKEVKPGHYLEIDYNDIYEHCLLLHLNLQQYM
jgi:asparagine synthase (glutamine-hydrolysing)